MLVPYINKLLSGDTLNHNEAREIAQIIVRSDNEAQIAAVLALITRNGITIEEITGFVSAVRESGVAIVHSKPTLDIVGTGGDNANTVNISTASALLVASCGIPVIKNGNRKVTSCCGAADVLEILGFDLKQNQEQISKSLEQNNFAFCFAPNFYPLLANIKKVRNNLGIPTIFNLLGPLLNPANSKHILLGVYDPKYVPLLAKALQYLKTERSLVFHGNGLDELTTMGEIKALLVTSNTIDELIIKPQDLGLKTCILTDLKGGDASYNAQIIRDTLSGVDTSLTDTLILNAGVALYLYGKVNSLQDGVKIAKERLKMGKILPTNRLQEIIQRKKVVRPAKKSLKKALMQGGAVIAEIKRASPSAGKIADIADPVDCALSYVKSGANAISVLTDEGFSGSITDLVLVSEALKETSIPILCKDFFISVEQIAEAAASGADAILIMISVLGERANKMIDLAHEFGLETLVEVHNAKELAIALATNADVIGVNQRDLRDFSMHPELMAALIKEIPAKIVKVAESGIEDARAANKMYRLGYNAVLVGTALSKLADAKEFFNNLVVEKQNAN